VPTLPWFHTFHENKVKVSEVALMMDRMTGKSRGFAFVTMNDN